MSIKGSLKFKQIKDFNLWDEMNEKSIYGSVFSSTKYLKGINNKFHLWGVYHNEELKAGLSIIVNNKEDRCIFNEWVIYSGIIFNFNEKISKFKKNNDSFMITEFIIEKITKIYKSFDISLIFKIADIRPFQWFNYGKNTKNKFIINSKYTSLLNISELSNVGINVTDTDLYKNLDTSRKQRIKEGKKKGFKFKSSKNKDDLIRLYTDMMKRNKKTVSKKKLLDFSNFLGNIIKKNLGLFFNLYDNKNNLLYTVMYIWDNKRSYYLLGAKNNKIKNSWGGTLINWEVFKYIAKYKSLGEIDLEGINSPNRGSFKLSFGGSIISYFQIIK